jgi:hypothetical protein
LRNTIEGPGGPARVPHVAAILYRCPNTGFRVQGWFEDRSENGDETYETVA